MRPGHYDSQIIAMRDREPATIAFKNKEMDYTIIVISALAGFRGDALSKLLISCFFAICEVKYVVEKVFM